MQGNTTRERLLDAAYRILAEESLSQLSIDRVSARAGLSRRTFFLHFTSKDQLLAEVLGRLRSLHAETYRQWAEGLDPSLPVAARIEALFRQVIGTIGDPGWKGSNFLRISAEFADRPGHPAHAPVAEVHSDMEAWFTDELAQGGYGSPDVLAKQLIVILNGLLIMQLVHRTSSYGEAVLRMLPDLLARGSGTV